MRRPVTDDTALFTDGPQEWRPLQLLHICSLAGRGSSGGNDRDEVCHCESCLS